VRREKISTAIDMPLSNECKRILAYAAEETERLRHAHIDTEHLLLGMLREENCVAAQVLHGLGLRVDSIRGELARDPISNDAGLLMTSGRCSLPCTARRSRSLFSYPMQRPR